MPLAEDYVAQCQQWVETFIGKRSICPFAERVIQGDLLEYRCLDIPDTELVLTELFMIIQAMQANETPETMLVVLPPWQDDFDDFLMLTEFARVLLEEYDLSATFQFANFHPNYMFADENPDSASHYTNRAPWPMLHILRQSSISKALEHYPEPEKIPERNIELMQHIGTEVLAATLSRLQKS